MINKSFYHGRQGECFQKIDKHFNEIRYEYQSQPNKTFLSKDFFYEGDSDPRLQPTKGEWKILGIGSGEHEGQSFNNYLSSKIAGLLHTVDQEFVTEYTTHSKIIPVSF